MMILCLQRFVKFIFECELYNIKWIGLQEWWWKVVGGLSSCEIFLVWINRNWL